VLQIGTTNYLYGMERLAAQTGSTRAWYGADALGSVRQTLDAAGAPQATTSYDPWGQLQTGSVPTFGFTGELHDGAAGLVHLRARWYNTRAGTLTSVDPFAGFAEQPYSQHPYQYAYSNPIIWTDPSGWCVPGARGCPKRENVVNTGRQWCQDGIDQTPTDGIDDCAIAQDTSVFWNSFRRRALANDAQYDRLLSRSTPRAPKAPGNPLCRMRGMEYLCSAFCLGQEEPGCCGPQVDDWFAEDVRLHWDWVQNARVTAPVGGSLIGGTVGSIVGAVRGGLPGALVGGFVGGTGGAAGGWFGGFALYARGIPHKGYDFPTVGTCGTGTCQGTVTLCGQCIDRSELGNMMYGIMAREWGFRYAITLAAAWQYGGMDTTADEAVIAIGYNVIRRRPLSGTSLCDQIRRWPRTWTGYASDPWTTGGCTPCGADLPPGTPHTRPSFGSQLP
jgi:RHS repeat-associated protein